MLRDYQYIVALLVALLIGCDVLAEKSPDSPRYKLVEVVDGDTIRISYQGKTQPVRLIGIDTPESRENPRAFKQVERSHSDLKTILAQGKLASQHLKSLLSEMTEVAIEFDIEHRDHYGRLLCYVYRPDGLMVNEEMLRSGYAQLLTIPPNVRYVDRFKKIAATAQKNKVGLYQP